MLAVHPLSLLDQTDLNPDDLPMPRLALAGGSDWRPPPDRPVSAQIIRFPLEKVRRGIDERPDTTTDDSPPDLPPTKEPSPDVVAKGNADNGLALARGSLWTAWMADVLGRSGHDGGLDAGTAST